MTENEKRLSAEERKQKIRERYKGVDKEEDTRYRFRGEYVGAGENKMLLFQLDEPEMIKTEEITLPPQEPEQDGTEEEKEEITRSITISRKSKENRREIIEEVILLANTISKKKGAD